MDYCQETVVIQSAFLLAENMMNLEQNLQKHELFSVVKIIKEAISEISEGLSIEKTPVLPIETYALHRKIHHWLHKAWRQGRYFSSDDVCYLERFPALPTFGTGCYVLIVKEMGWELLLAEVKTLLLLIFNPLDSDCVNVNICGQLFSFNYVYFHLSFSV